MSVAKTRVLRWISGNTQKNRIHNKEICLKIGWLLLMKRWERFARDGLVMFKGELESTDAAGRVPHPSLMRLPSRRCHVWAFFFFNWDSRRLGSIRADSALIHAEPDWFGQNRAISAISVRIGRQLKRPEQSKFSP